MPEGPPGQGGNYLGKKVNRRTHNYQRARHYSLSLHGEFMPDPLFSAFLLDELAEVVRCDPVFPANLDRV